MSARRYVILVLFALAEASVIEPILLFLPTPLRAIDSGVALVVTWLLLCAIAFSRRILAWRESTLLWQRIVLGAWLAGMLVVSVAIVNATQGVDPRSLASLFVEFGGVLLLWWRGIALGVTDFGPDAARVRLQMGLLAFILFAIATMFNPGNGLLAFVLPFLVGALFAMPLSHIERVEQSVLGRRVVMDAIWWRSLAVGIGLPLFASMAMTVLVTGDALSAGLRLLIAVLLVPILAIALVVGYLVSLLVSLLLNKMTRNPFEGFQGLANLLNQMRAPPDKAPGIGITIPPDLRFALGLLALAVIGTILIWLTGRARREAQLLNAESENLRDLGPADRPSPRLEDSIWRSFNLRRWLAALSVRRIYARMSHEAAKRGFARLPAQTPNDYLPRLAEAFPDADADVRMITNAYIAAHYGEVPDTDEALGQIRQAWERVRNTPKQARSAPAGQLPSSQTP